ncbi:hypothetical protein EMIT0196P_50082 [Pseudomonas chlororaphis]
MPAIAVTRNAGVSRYRSSRASLAPTEEAGVHRFSSTPRGFATMSASYPPSAQPLRSLNAQPQGHRQR